MTNAMLFLAGFIGVTILDFAIVVASASPARNITFVAGTILGSLVGIWLGGLTR